jgi:dipeptidyl aminopeptidase/acylaminoacyl peptidase
VEGYRQPPELAVLGSDGPQVVSSLAHAGHAAALVDAGDARAVSWHASDGAVVDGLLVLPAGDGPHPLVTYVHGGPVWAWRSRWSMGYAYTLLLARHGYAVLHPNPRGSSGRGEAFRAAVLGDLGGAECDDLLSGLDALVEQGIADPARLGLFGGSHGGFVASWLVTQTDRFAAAVPYCPVTDWCFQRLTSNDQAAQDHLLAGRPGRDPLAHAAAVTTPTLVLTGSRDLITPASQGLAFHRAVAEAGAPTGYVEYPLEGHGVRTFPAQIDFSARLLGWFDHFMRGAHDE